MDLNSVQNRAHTLSGRFRRSSVYAPPAEGSATITLIKGHEASLLRLLNMMELRPTRKAKEQVATLVCQEFGFFHGWMIDLFRIGGTDADNGVGLAIMPRARRVFGKIYPRATIIIPIQISPGSNFVIYLTRNNVTKGLDISVGWTEDVNAKHWPESQENKDDLFEKVVIVLNIVESLFVWNAQAISA